jgi:hypothetical protein
MHPCKITLRNSPIIHHPIPPFPISPFPQSPTYPSFHLSKTRIAEKNNSSFEFFFKKWDNIDFKNEEKQV